MIYVTDCTIRSMSSYPSQRILGVVIHVFNNRYHPFAPRRFVLSLLQCRNGSSFKTSSNLTYYPSENHGAFETSLVSSPARVYWSWLTFRKCETSCARSRPCNSFLGFKFNYTQNDLVHTVLTIGHPDKDLSISRSA